MSKNWIEINQHFLINEASYQKYFCFRTFTGEKSNFVPNGIRIGFEMAKKKVYRHTDKLTFSYL